MPQIKKKSRERYITAIKGYAMPEYDDLVLYRERVDDCLQGQHSIKSKRKYLPPTKWQTEHPDDYEAYVRRALFYSLTAYAMRIYEGLSMSGQPNVILPSDGRMDFILKNATVHGRDLHALQYTLNREQLAHGLRCMLLKSTNDAERPFIIQEFCANSFLNAYFDQDENGFSKARMILLDISHDQFNLKTKGTDFVPMLMVFGLDRNDEYYQCPLSPEEWPDFDVLEPKHPAVKYPECWERRNNIIPFTWCNASSLSGCSLDIPPLLDMCDCELKLFEFDALLSQHIVQSAQETVFFLNAPANFKLEKVRYGCGAHNTLLKDMDVKVISNNGIGFEAQKNYMDSLMTQIELRRMSIMSSKSHQSGTAVGIVQNAQTAPLRTVIETSGEAITQQLRHMARWMQYDNEEVEKVLYTPSQSFAHVDGNLSEFVMLCQAVADGTVPMLESDLYRLAIDNGHINSKEEWPDFRAKWHIELNERASSLLVTPKAKTAAATPPVGK